MTRRKSTQAEESAVGLRFLYRAGVSPSSPLIILVHGRAGNRSVMWTFERGLPEDCHVVSFEAFLPDPIGGWSWWDMEAPGSKREAIVYAAHKLKTALTAFCNLFSLEPERVVALGFSQGSVLVSATAFLGLAEFDGVAVLAGFVFLPSAELRLTRMPSMFIAHGTADETISVKKARDGVEALTRLGVGVRYIEEEVGHKVGIQGTRALREWVREVLAAPHQA